jgi:5-methylcytosine-specific restriction protein A
LITFKPASENPERGWPLQEIQRLVRRRREGGRVIEKWRFHNRNASRKDRVFLLLQGKRGPAIIGYGQVAGESNENDGKRQVPVEFESIVDPSTHVLASREDLNLIEEGQRFWRSQASGVQLDEGVAKELEALVVGKPAKRADDDSISNPGWTRDELILALSFYLQHRPNPPGKGSKEIRELSDALRRLGEKLFSLEDRSATFRNENGVYMKLMNFRRLDPEYVAGGKKGLSRGAKAEEQVWVEFSADPANCRRVAEAIMSGLDKFEVNGASLEPDTGGDIQEAPEGRLLTRMHLARERNRALADSKRKQALKKHGKLACEACGFDFALRYGERGKGFIECHHTKALATLADGHKTHINDLALVCSNCHRMIHRAQPWLSVAELRKLLAGKSAD